MNLPEDERHEAWGSSVPDATVTGPGVAGWLRSLTDEDVRLLLKAHPEPVRLLRRVEEPQPRGGRTFEEHRARVVKALEDHGRRRRGEAP